MVRHHDNGENLTKSTSKASWEQKLPEEIAWWKEWIASQGLDYGDDFPSRLDPDRPLQPHIGALLDQVKTRPLRILDVGAGPLTCLGKVYRGERLEITAVDPLADVYDSILRDAEIRPLTPTTWCHGELLEERFASNTFDLVYAQNALDHSYDPFRIIVSMIRLTKPGQFAMLEHRQDEAERARYTGLHQWNFALREGNFVIWNASHVVNVTDVLRNYVTIENQFNPAVDWLVTTIKKHSDPPRGLGIVDVAPTRPGWPWRRKAKS